MKKIFLFIVSVLMTTVAVSQTKQGKAINSKPKTTVNSAKQRVQMKIDPKYEGVVGDYLPFVVFYNRKESTMIPECEIVVGAVAQFLKNHPNVKLVVAGYAEMGVMSESEALKLSENRAIAVKSLLVDKYKINESRLIANGMGEDEGFISTFCNRPSAVVFFEQGFITHMEYAEKMERKSSDALGALANILFSDNGESTCDRCNGSGMIGGEACPKCKGKGRKWSEEQATREISKDVKKLQSANKNVPVQKTKTSDPNNGYQIKVYKNGTYEGYLKDGKRHGRGTFTFENGSKYSGVWTDDEITGFGMNRSVMLVDMDEHFKPILKCQRHVGEWNKGHLESFTRTLFDFNGDVYSGGIKDGKYYAYGVKQYADGTKYSGVWNNGMYEGEGCLQEKDGGIYNGYFSKGKKHGAGSYLYPNKNRYTGGYRDGEMYGDGVFFDVKTHICTYGFWISGKMTKKKYTESFTDDEIFGETKGKKYEEGDTYEGGISFGVPHGIGTYTWKNGNKYVGAWRYGKRNGKGTFTWPSGDIYTGAFKMDVRNGKGIYTWANGDRYDGEWLDGFRQGKGTLFDNETHKYVEGVWKDNKIVEKKKVGLWKDSYKKTK